MNANPPIPIKFLDTRLPRFTKDEAEQIGRDVFGLMGRPRPLSGERDQNFCMRAADGSEFVLKFANDEESPGVIDFQTAALQHLSRVDPSLPIPAVRMTVRGEPYTWVENLRGEKHIARSLSYLPGSTYFGRHRPAESWRSLGSLLGRMDRAFHSFFHPGARHELVWDVQRSPELRPYTGFIEDAGVRRNVDRVLNQMAEEVLPGLGRVRHQVIHSDIHADNILFDPKNPDVVTGVLDFGDMVYGPLAAEIAIAADMDYVGKENIESCLAALVSGYDRVNPLEETDLELIYPLMLARYAATITILAARRAQSPGLVSSAPEEDAPLRQFLEDLLTLGAARIGKTVRRACGYPVVQPAASIEKTLERRNQILGPHSPIFYEKPVQVVRSSGAWLYGAEGEAFLDAYNNVPVAGHCHPHVVRAISRQTAMLNTNTRYLYDIILDYAERLTGTLAQPLSVCLFANSGSEANDIAWQIARYYTKQQGGIVVEAAYHGVTDATRPMSPSDSGRKLAPHIKTIENPDPYRGRFRYGERDLAEKYAADADRAVSELDEAGLGTAAFVIDSAFVSSGIPDVPPGYLVQVAEKVRGAGGLVIADEVQAGFGRSGTHLWGHGSHRLVPDIVTMGKPVANGYPMGVVITRPDILEPFMAQYSLFSTFGGNPVACAAANAVLDVIEQEALMDNARETGAYLLSELRNRMADYPLIGDVRAWGLLLGVELVVDREMRTPAPMQTRAFLNQMRANGVLMGSEGLHGNVLKIRPPLVFNRDHADIFLQAFDRSMRTLL